MSKQTLTRERERELFIAWRNGDEDAGNEIVEHFRQWATTFAINFNRGEPDEELIASSFEGLASAMRQFDLDRGFRFSTLARVVVRQSIRRQIDQRARATDHLALMGSILPEEITDTVPVEPADIESAESVDRLIFLVEHCSELSSKTKEILRLFVKHPNSTLKEVGEKVGVTRAGVQHHLSKIRAVLLDDPEIGEAALEAGLSLVGR